MSQESSDLIIILLFAFLGKAFYDFKMMGGFNYPLLIRIVHMIIILVCLILFFHSTEVKHALKQTKIEDYLKKTTK